MLIYTTAPVDYDYGYVLPVADNVAVTDRGKVVRLVEIPADRVDYQCGRYQSGLCWVGRQADYDKQIASGWMMTPTPDARVDYYRRKFDLSILPGKSKEIRVPITRMIVDTKVLTKEGIGMYSYVLTIKGDKERFDRLCKEIDQALGANGIDLEMLAYLDAQED